MFFEKAVQKIFGKFLKNHLQQRVYWKLIIVLEILRTAILKENLLMDVTYFITLLDECFWWGNTEKNFSGSKPSSKLILKQNGTTVLTAVIILEVVNNWKSMLQINILKIFYRKCMLPLQYLSDWYLDCRYVRQKFCRKNTQIEWLFESNLLRSSGYFNCSTVRWLLQNASCKGNLLTRVGWALQE